MQQKTFEELLDLFLANRLKSEQRKDILDRINRDEDQDPSSNWFYHLWDETRMKKHDKKSREAFSKLKSKLDLKEDNLRLDNYFFLRSYSGNLTTKIQVRYAAVFLVTFGLAWLGFNLNERGSLFTHSSRVNEIAIPNGSKGYMTLEDGTQIWMNSGSRLKYSEFSTTPVREVYLEGEAFFDVTHDRNKPFIVNTSYLKIKVLGTRFNVKSYPSEKTTETTLVSGKVEIEEINNKTDNKKLITLEPNQKVIFYNATGMNAIDDKTSDVAMKPKISEKLQIIEKVNPELYTSWKDEKLIFYNERFESLIIKLERWYNVRITLKDTSLKDYRYTGKFEKENIEQALKALKLTTPMEYFIDKDRIIISALGKTKESDKPI
jgi:ferric-dicitrate binding protein FerR (iron transport regulator)